MTGHDEQNPLARALDEVSAGPEARAFVIPVETVRAGARRRRARRTGVTSGLAALVVVAMAGGAYAGLPHRSGAPPILPGPGPAPSSQVQADWPAQFLRCGLPIADALPHVAGDVSSLTVADASSSIPASSPWSASVTVDVPAAPADSSAVVWGTDLSVMRNGIVVGVQEGPSTPDLSLSLSERLAGGGLRTSPFPVTTQVTRALASCDQYPSGQGSPYLAPGSYTLVVTQTLSYATTPGINPTLTDVRSSVSTALTITDPVSADGTASQATAGTGATTSDAKASLPTLTRCGAPGDELAALAGTHAAPYTAALNPHPTPYGYPDVPASPVLTPVPGPWAALYTVEDPVVVALQGGMVVARSVVVPSPNSPSAWAGGITIAYPDPPALTRCPGVPAPSDGGPGLQGDYVLRLVVELSAVGAEPGTWLIASAPAS